MKKYEYKMGKISEYKNNQLRVRESKRNNCIFAGETILKHYENDEY